MDYYCPMHSEVRREAAGKCPRCGMDLVPAGTRFPLLRHVAGNRLHIAIMIVAMLGLMAAAMLLM